MPRKTNAKIKASSVSGKDAYAQAMAGIADRKQVGDRGHPVTAPGVERPTPEQIGAFELLPVRTERGQVAARAYRRQPYFETLAKQPGDDRLISPVGLAALRVYRSAWERCEASITRCALDVDGRGGGGYGSRMPASMVVDRRVQAYEAAMGAYIETMRQVALFDMTLTDVAIERFGGRVQDWIVVTDPVLKPDGQQLVVEGVGPQWRKTFHEKIVPKSGRHREMIRDEFRAGLALLIEATER